MAIKDEQCAQTQTGKMCTNVSLHTHYLRQQFGADLLISIATFTAVGDSDIMKIDCHKKNLQYSKKRATVIWVLAKVQWCSSLPGDVKASGGGSSLVNKEETYVKGLS